MNLRTSTLLLAALASLSGCGPKDDVLSWKMGLLPPQSVAVPAALATELSSNDFLAAGGRLRADVPAALLEATLAGLPSAPGAQYRLNLLLGHARIHPQSTLTKVLSWVYPTAYAHEETEPPVRIPMVDFLVESGGQAALKLEAVQVSLAYVAGAEVELIAAGEQTGAVVLQGVIGNLDEPGDVVDDGDSGGGHTH